MNGDEPAKTPQPGEGQGAPAPAPAASEPTAPAVMQPEPQPQQAPAPIQAEEDGDPFGATDEIEEPEIPAVSWEGPEFVASAKSSKWYLALVAAAVVAAVVVFLATKDGVSAVTIVVVGAMLAFLGGRKPKQIVYAIGRNRIAIGQKEYEFTHFRSYAVMREGGQPSIALHPLQRFMPLVNLYYPPEREEIILDTLNDHLPAEERDHDYIDRFLHRIKF